MGTVMKKLFLSFALLTMIAMAFGQAEPVDRDLSGFSGYGWGTSIDFIASSMDEEDYDSIAATREELWYRGQLVGEPLQIVYLFKSGLLTGGIWVFDIVDQRSFWKINNHLLHEYNTTAKLKVRGETWIETEMRPKDTDALIIHRLDVDADRHVVNYYYQRGEE